MGDFDTLVCMQCSQVIPMRPDLECCPVCGSRSLTTDPALIAPSHSVRHQVERDLADKIARDTAAVAEIEENLGVRQKRNIERAEALGIRVIQGGKCVA